MPCVKMTRRIQARYLENISVAVGSGDNGRKHEATAERKSLQLSRE